jgi:hypothetical protein
MNNDPEPSTGIPGSPRSSMGLGLGKILLLWWRTGTGMGKFSPNWDGFGEAFPITMAIVGCIRLLLSIVIEREKEN